MTEDDALIEIQIRTRHPERYELRNLMDGTRWRIADGHWSQVVAGPDEAGNVRYVTDDLVDKIHRWQHTDGTCRQGVTCRKLATAKTTAPIFLKILGGDDD